jgi:hypothetical protein
MDGVMADTPVTVTFTIQTGDVWISPSGEAWRVRYPATIAGDVFLERVVTAVVPPRELVRDWLKQGDA